MQAPIEVFEAVIDEASDNPASLRLLSLTCRAFLPRSRYHLFSCIVIRSVEQMESSSELLDACPWLPPLVRKIVLSVQVSEDNSIPNVRLFDVVPVPLLDVVPVPLLSRLPNLRAWGMGMRVYRYGRKNGPQLLLHHSALWRYQKYGGRIQNLELTGITMEDLSDFMGLLSAFTSVHSLTCSRIDFRIPKEPNSPYDSISARNMLARSLRIENLVAGRELDICATEYLLASSAATLDRLVIAVQSGLKGTCPDYFERLETAMSQLSHLSSLTLGIPAYGDCYVPWEHTDTRPGIAHDMRLATKILKCVRRDRLREVGVDVKIETMATLGCCLSCGSRSSEACKALEDALLTFPSCRIVLCDTIRTRRAGRAQFWSETINGAFPRLKERGLFTFTPCAPTDTQDPYGHEAHVKSLAASRDSKRVVTASSDGTIIVWDVERGTPMYEWFAAVPAGPICSLALSPDGRRLVSVTAVLREGGPLVVWDISDGNSSVRKVATLELEGGKGRPCCALSFDGALIASVSGDGMVYIWDAQTFQRRGGALNRSSAHAAGYPYRLQFSPDSRYLGWVSGSPAKCYISQPLTEEPLASYFLDPDPRPDRQTSKYFPICAFSFDPESRRIVTAHGTRHNAPEKNVVRIWDIATGTLVAVLGDPSHTWDVTEVSFSPDGRSVLSASISGSVTIWDVESGKQKALLKALDSDVSQRRHARSPLQTARFSPNGRYVAVVSGIYCPGRNLARGIVSLWRTSDASCMVEFIDHGRAWVLDVVFSPNGEFLASADIQGIVHIRRLSNFIGN